MSYLKNYQNYTVANTVNEPLMTEEEFYEHCYNLGVKEIEQHLLVGAASSEMNVETIETFGKFLLTWRFDGTASENAQAKYAFLKRTTVNTYRPNIKNVVTAVSYRVGFDNKKEYTLDIFDTSNIYSVNLSSDKKYFPSNETQ